MKTLSLFAAGLLAACQSPYPAPKVEFGAPPTVAVAPQAAAKPPSAGSLFDPAHYRPAFEDRRARLVGDNLTIQIVENISAVQKSSSTQDRSASLASGVTGLPFMNATVLGKASAGGSSANSFAGKGDNETANTFTGAITVTVVEVLPNGQLRVAGEKQIGVNQNVDVLRFTGTVDPRAIQAGNTIDSTLVADVRVESRGRGAHAEALTTGWLSRLFFSVLPF